jgi:hypothetical protein
LREINRRAVLTSIVVISTLLIASSIIATSQAWWLQKLRPKYVDYELEAIIGPSIITDFDDSGAPDIVIEGTHDSLLEGTITINDKVYSYPDDFEYTASFHIEVNAITGEGFIRSVNTFTFKLKGRPAITGWLISRVTGMTFTPDGELAAPEEIKFEGSFQLSGTKQFDKVEGFGLEEGHMIPIQQGDETTYTNNVHHFGFIKDYPLANK